MVTVSRSSFMAYARGVLLNRDASGACIVGDSVTNENAEAALSKGEKIALMVGGEVVSYMQLIDGEYCEFTED